MFVTKFPNLYNFRYRFYMWSRILHLGLLALSYIAWCTYKRFSLRIWSFTFSLCIQMGSSIPLQSIRLELSNCHHFRVDSKADSNTVCMQIRLSNFFSGFLSFFSVCEKDGIVESKEGSVGRRSEEKIFLFFLNCYRQMLPYNDFLMQSNLIIWWKCHE